MADIDLKINAERAPDPADLAQARVGIERWLAALTGADGIQLALGRAVAEDPAGRRILEGLFGNSSYLTLLAELDPTFVIDVFGDGPVAAHARIMTDIGRTAAEAAQKMSPGVALRLAKRRLAFVTAVADVCEDWTLSQVTGALSGFAGAALDAAAAYLLAEAHAKGILKLAEPARPTRDSGLIILGMGKLGGHELNYSSDIDLIIFYDPERMSTPDRDSLQTHLIRLVRQLVRLMSDRRPEGYVFRTDLRLRPDPGSTPPAISVLAAEEYYESLGQNWERAALIKARPVAGDIDAGRRFLQRLRPFIWRKHLDFAAIADIHSIKRQINAHRAGDRLRLAGHNIKLGRGGIREIEFFVQTQQLIWGGRLPALRVAETEAALVALADAGKIDSEAVLDLTRAYRFLRRIEHRLQMTNDEQTHTLPTDPVKLRALAVFSGFADVDAFGEAVLATLRTVEGYYGELFQDSPALTATGGGVGDGNLVFTGSEPDPETLETLARLGFANPRLCDSTIRGWHHGRYRAMRSARARELLTELMPHLLKALAKAPDSDAAFLAFDRFLKALPAGVQFFSMVCANMELLTLVTRILGFGPGMADMLAVQPAVLERVVSVPDFFAPLPARPTLEAELTAVLGQGAYWEEKLDLSRRWANERRFQVAVHHLLDPGDIDQATGAWSDIAEAALACLLPLVAGEFAAVHGTIAGCELAIVGLGKLGSREMNPGSDLDLIFVYGTPPEGALSDGRKPLPASQYFARLGQRLINALAAPTGEGRLFEVDMRLRPSGKAGPIAVSVESFVRYQSEMAWTWEQMALTRARVVAGPAELASEVERCIRVALMRRRDPGALVRDVADMRERLAREFGSGSAWEIKHRRGGLIDIAFMVQYLQLLHAGSRPEVLVTGTRDALARLAAAGLIATETAAGLSEALSLWLTVQSRLRLAFGSIPIVDVGGDAAKALRLALSGIDGLDFESLVDKMQRLAERAHQAFVELVEKPAAVAAYAASSG
ncbi:MAG: bifunctional [glutamine synthetase] adenylyltransferase/[glutamine synthetase]-adenylyl-L-tyrosine phosphorylase [Rhodospirillales bacterium]